MKNAYNYKIWERGFIHNSTNHILNQIREKYLKSKKNLLVLDVGCGNKPFEEWLSPLTKEYIGVDIINTDKNDVRCDAKNLPFKNKTFDLVLCTAVLEHDPHPQKIVDEIRRVLKKEGIVICACPFAGTTHGLPYDYYRFTYFGMQHLFKNFKEIEIYQNGGIFKTFGFIFGEKFCDIQYINKITKALGVIGLFKILGILIYPLVNIPCRILDWIFFKKGKPTAGAFPQSHWLVAKK